VSVLLPVRGVRYNLEHSKSAEALLVSFEAEVIPENLDLRQVYGEATALTNSETTDLSILTLESCHETGLRDFIFDRTSVYITGLLVNRLDLSLL
jgi:hypothetical protein